MLNRICVFCGSKVGSKPAYEQAAARLGKALAHRGIGLVYGGATPGLMGTIADTVLAEQGEVIGVIPDRMVAREIAHAGLSDLRVVASMLHGKPCGLLNVEGFFDPLLAYLDHAVAEGFLKPAHRALILDDSDPEHLLDLFSRNGRETP